MVRVSGEGNSRPNDTAKHPTARGTMARSTTARGGRMRRLSHAAFGPVNDAALIGSLGPRKDSLAEKLLRLLKKVQMRGGARRLHAKRTLCTLSVRPRAPTKQMGLFQQPARHSYAPECERMAHA